MLTAALLVLAAYLLGGVMGGDVLRAVLGGGDLRASGSGNVGATNALRTRGPAFALGVLAIDLGKGVLAARALPALAGPLPAAAVEAATLPYLCGGAAALGHCYPALHRFRGGKGVATLAGVFLSLLPQAGPWLLGAFVLIVLGTGWVSLASIGAGAVALFHVACIGADGLFSAKGAFTGAMLALILFKHRANVVRLVNGSESRFERARVLGRALERLTRAARSPR